jgi:hypothetical protein
MTHKRTKIEQLADEITEEISIEVWQIVHDHLLSVEKDKKKKN